jgi:PAS domain S-box-containing protein
MQTAEPVKILLVDDQPAKLLSYETVLTELGEDLIRANSAREALEQLLKNEIAVILIDVVMPDLDGFQLAEMIREHPRFKKTAIIFVSAVQMADSDRLRGYHLGAVDYVPVPVVPELLRAKVKVFAELFRKTQQLEKLNEELERRVEERTAALEISNERLKMAMAVAQLATWEWDFATDKIKWQKGYVPFPGYDTSAGVKLDDALARVHEDDRATMRAAFDQSRKTGKPYHQVHRSFGPDGTIVWRDARANPEFDAKGKAVRLLGVVMDISEHKLAEERQEIMLQELHHRVKNTLATVKAIANLSKRTATDVESFCNAFNSRIVSLSKTHTLLVSHKWSRIGLIDILTSEISGFDDGIGERVVFRGPSIDLPSQTALSLGMAFHELTTNAAKYGSLSVPGGRLAVDWTLANGTDGNHTFNLQWRERGGPPVQQPTRQGFGSILMEKLFDGQAGVSMKIQFQRSGLEFDLAMPWSPHEAQPTQTEQ